MTSAPSRAKANPTIQDVARAAGVSTATVSRALSNSDKVSAQTLKRVQDAVAQTKYVMNHTARSLRQQRSNSICVVVPALLNSFFSMIIAGVEQVATKAGYRLFLVDTNLSDGGDFHVARLIESVPMDGLLVIDGGISQQDLLDLEAAGRLMPSVLICEWRSDTLLPSVTVDNAGGASLAVSHLARLGHEKIGHLTGPKGHILGDLRVEGFRRGLENNELSISDQYLFQSEFSMASGRQAADTWLGMKDRPTAVFCASDSQAFGFISHLTASGVRVPQDMSVIGFDDVEAAAYFVPSLSTISQPTVEMGRRAADLLVRQIAGEHHSDQESVTLGVELVVRDSTAAPSSP